MTNNRDADATRFATESLSQGDPTGWFEKLYAAAADGDAIVPWDAAAPNALLVEWIEQQAATGQGKRAMVVGCGLGRDAEYIAAQGFQTTAFDISDTAIRGAGERFPASTVHYRAADLLDPPAEWTHAFDLVVESITVQSMPISVRAEAISHVARMVAPGGELLVIAGARAEGAQVDGPPWPLTRAELESFAADGLSLETVDQTCPPDRPDALRWRALFRRA
ncbi:class I SAM-dependent methyltransferase [Nocardia sp. NPDC052566]|uniref:class I SAM-dependent methyltransferase n=1 Tax=Nocardia sp. NPDC052566 TaxID=3364330 RepID=UPI0037C9D5C6